MKYGEEIGENKQDTFENVTAYFLFTLCNHRVSVFIVCASVYIYNPRWKMVKEFKLGDPVFEKANIWKLDDKYLYLRWYSILVTTILGTFIFPFPWKSGPRAAQTILGGPGQNFQLDPPPPKRKSTRFYLYRAFGGGGA